MRRRQVSDRCFTLHNGRLRPQQLRSLSPLPAAPPSGHCSTSLSLSLRPQRTRRCVVTSSSTSHCAGLDYTRLGYILGLAQT